VVTGIAALVRALSPQLTARQVMRRIEDTARRPSAGWDPWVGHGMVDALAAVSADGAPPPVTDRFPPTALTDRAPAAADAAPRRVSLIGAAGCVAVAATVTALTAGALRRRRESVAKD
jgi:membrane-anchored mycosin MYCP